MKIAEHKGRYDDICGQILRELNVNTLLLIVLDSKERAGFSLASRLDPSILNIPDILRDVANSIEKQIEGSVN
jgi:hypothetical protein